MDPVTVIGVAAAAFATVAAIGRCARNLHLLKEKFQIVYSILDVIIQRLGTIQSCLHDLAQWAQRQQGRIHCSKEFSSALNLSIAGCNTFLQCLDAQLVKFYRGHGDLISFSRGRYLLREATFSTYLNHLDKEIAALNLLLACHQT